MRETIKKIRASWNKYFNSVECSDCGYSIWRGEPVSFSMHYESGYRVFDPHCHKCHEPNDKL